METLSARPTLRGLDAANLSKMDHDQGAYRRHLGPNLQGLESVASPHTPNHVRTRGLSITPTHLRRVMCGGSIQKDLSATLCVCEENSSIQLEDVAMMGEVLFDTFGEAAAETICYTGQRQE